MTPARKKKETSAIVHSVAFPKAAEGVPNPLRYEVHFKRPKKTAGPEDEGGEHTEASDVARESQVREAIRAARRLLKTCLPGTQVTVRAFGPGRPAKRGRVEFQAHVGATGKIVVEER